MCNSTALISLAALKKCVTASAVLFSLAVLQAPLFAHEYWIEPTAYRYMPGKKVQAHLRNGENFKGVSIPFLPKRTRSVKVHAPQTDIVLNPRLGDVPALQYTATETGWHMFAVQTQPQTLSYTEPGKFQKFMHAHDFTDFVNANESLIGADNVFESYNRYAKSLILVAASNIQAASYPSNLTTSTLKFEWVLDKEVAPTAESISLQLLLDGAPVPNRQAEVYFKSNLRASMDLYQTDSVGKLQVPTVESGSYLINAVWATMVSPSEPSINTDWASLTFGVTAK